LPPFVEGLTPTVVLLPVLPLPLGLVLPLPLGFVVVPGLGLVVVPGGFGTGTVVLGRGTQIGLVGLLRSRVVPGGQVGSGTLVVGRFTFGTLTAPARPPPVSAATRIASAIVNASLFLTGYPVSPDPRSTG
jgi:hypothetical protein